MLSPYVLLGIERIGGLMLTSLLTFEGLRAKRAYIEFWLIFIFSRIELIFGGLTCFDIESIVL